MYFALHDEIAEEYNGHSEWDYRRLTTVFLEGDLSLLGSDDFTEFEDGDNNHDECVQNSLDSSALI